MIKPLVLSIGCLCATIFGTAQDVLPLDLEQFQWKNRLLFLFAPSRDDPDFAKLHNEIQEQRDGVNDRDLIVFEVLGRGDSQIDLQTLPQQEAQALQDQFSVTLSQFRTILVGKDGGKKYDRVGTSKLHEIFNLIDAMPMRIDEMRRKNP